MEKKAVASVQYRFRMFTITCTASCTELTYSYQYTEEAWSPLITHIDKDPIVQLVTVSTSQLEF